MAGAQPKLVRCLIDVNDQRTARGRPGHAFRNGSRAQLIDVRRRYIEGLHDGPSVALRKPALLERQSTTLIAKVQEQHPIALYTDLARWADTQPRIPRTLNAEYPGRPTANRSRICGGLGGFGVLGRLQRVAGVVELAVGAAQRGKPAADVLEQAP